MLRWRQLVTADRPAGHADRSAGAPRRVLACALNPRQQARLAAAVRDRVPLDALETFQALRDLLREPPHGVVVVVVAARDGHGESARRTVRELAGALPRAAIVVYCHESWRQDTDIRTLAASGVHQFVFAGMNDDVLALRSTLAAARRQCAAEHVMELLRPIIPATLHLVAEAALARADAITDVNLLAAALGVHRKTLFNMCRRARFLAPAELLAWVRLALVAYLLETTGRTIDRIAIDLSYPSPTALRNTFRRHVGRPPSEVRSTDGTKAVLGALRLRVAARNPSGLHVV